MSYSKISAVVSRISGSIISSYNSSTNISIEFIDNRRAAAGGGGGCIIGSGVVGTGFWIVANVRSGSTGDGRCWIALGGWISIGNVCLNTDGNKGCGSNNLDGNGSLRKRFADLKKTIYWWKKEF